MSWTLTSMRRAMIREIQSALSRIPDGFKIYVFGSYLRRDDPADIDILGVYDQKQVPDADAHDRIQSFTHWLEERIGLPVHITLLSNIEAVSIGFIEAERCVELTEVIKLSQDQ